MIRLKYNHGRMYVWRRQKEFSYQCIKSTLKSIMNQGIMVWGCVSRFGVGKIVILKGKVNSQISFNLLKEVIIPKGKRLRGDNFILQQDNAPIHKAKTLIKYLQKCNKYIRMASAKP